MSTPEKKRRLTDEGGETSSMVPPSRPPLKKRFTSCVNIQPVVVIPDPEPVIKPVKIEYSVNTSLHPSVFVPLCSFSSFT